MRDAKQRGLGNFDEKELQHLETQVLYDMYVAAKPGGGTGMAAWKQYSEDIKREKCLMFLCLRKSVLVQNRMSIFSFI